MTAVNLNPPTYHPWMDDANCLDVDPDLFFSTDWHAIERAREICKGCRVKDLCLQYAIDQNEQHGVFGGETIRGRRRIEREAS